MAVDQDLLRQLILGGGRFTQDSPVLPNVWLEYSRVEYANPQARRRVDLLLTPHRRATAAQLASAVRQRLAVPGYSEGEPDDRKLAYTESYVVGRFTFRELCRVLLPLTGWWSANSPLWGGGVPSVETLSNLVETIKPALELSIDAKPEGGDMTPHLFWLCRLAGILEADRRGIFGQWEKGDWEKYRSPEGGKELRAQTAPVIAAAFLELATEALSYPEPSWAEEELSPLWLVNVNRRGSLAVARSRETVKTDVVEQAFRPDLAGIRWVVLDSGIDATHPAFRKRDRLGTLLEPAFSQAGGRAINNTRIVETYDFTRIRSFLSVEDSEEAKASLSEGQKEEFEELQRSLQSGRAIDWELLGPLLRVPHEPDGYEVPNSNHGTHVAGILAGDWRKDDPEMPEKSDLRGICPTLDLYDFRVLDGEEGSDEFSVIAALSFLRFLNAHANQPVVHGVNISISMLADVGSYACGRTPVCEECERLVNSGVVVVVAAGNEGFQQHLTTQGAGVFPSSGFQDISITDPGNTEAVITVGATHRVHPHTYGVSYFSSRGPTGDGRPKPDLVAPGEKIVGPVPGKRAEAMDGTSMAAPHVSGAAALLMARHRELIGRPARIKAVLMETATDLKRDAYFQGAGLLDIFRALQAV